MFSVDFHNHIGKSKSDGNRATAREVFRAGLAARLGLTHAVIFPIDAARPGISYSRLNTQIAALCKKSPHFIGFARLDPHAGEGAIREMHRSFALGLRGVKLHPRSENFQPREAEAILKELNRLKRPLILHTSHEPNSRPSQWQDQFFRYRKFPVILAHAGKDAYLEAVDVAKKLPNVYLETSTQSYFRTRLILKKLGPEKIVFASDFPYSHPRVEMEKWNQIWTARQKSVILSLNARKILKA